MRRTALRIPPFSPAVVALPALLLSGCFGGSLATDTGPRSAGDWSVARHQAAHVGEAVRFSFILTRAFQDEPVSPAGIADYCIIELDDRHEEAVLDPAGKFTLKYRMPEAWRDREISVTAWAYRQYGRRDRMAVGGELLEAVDTVDASDRIIARAKLTMLVYQSSVSLELAPGAEDFDFETGRLVLRRDDGTASTVTAAPPAVRGFATDYARGQRAWTIRYEPTGEQVNRTGTTEATFTVLDQAGHAHHVRGEFLTP